MTKKKPQQENKYNVGASQWRKWPDIAQRVFNELYETMRDNQSLFLHPKTEEVKDKQWNTTAYNAAWIAADAALKALKDIEKGVGYAEVK